MKFQTDCRDEFQTLKNGTSWETKADAVKQQMSEVFDAKYLSCLIGSRCSSPRHGNTERGARYPRRFYESLFTDLNDQEISGFISHTDVQRIVEVPKEVSGRAAA
ncbi:hypothetical protein [Hyphomonas atlantica corrig.]|uniref:hypothetical protein n=1 Tax=Hyphomonas atlantica TaxID=1280948 RepID=UPI002353258C|nr:hypothetical protein [Hyphomonas atlantica]